MLECGSSQSYVFKDACFSPECEDRIKIKTSSPDTKSSSTQIVVRYSLNRTNKHLCAAICLSLSPSYALHNTTGWRSVFHHTQHAGRCRPSNRNTKPPPIHETSAKNRKDQPLNLTRASIQKRTVRHIQNLFF